MIIQLKKDISPKQKREIINKVLEIGYKPSEIKTQFKNYLVCIGKNEFDIREIGGLQGVADTHRVSSHHKLVSNKWRVEPTKIDLGNNIFISKNDFNVAAGPCSIESVEHAAQTIKHLKENNVKIMRTMVFKPRSSPYSFRGIGIEGLREVSQLCKKEGIKIISEVMQVKQIEQMHDYVDIFQVGARNTQNFNLLDALGKVDKAVLIKRGLAGTIDELLYSAEYVFSNGNEKIILCERGIRTYENAYRNTFDLNAIPIIKEKTHLPVFADPSHSIGIRAFVEQMALSAIMADADGIIFETHPEPDKAFSDADQTISFKAAKKLYEKMKKTYELREQMKKM